MYKILLTAIFLSTWIDNQTREQVINVTQTQANKLYILQYSSDLKTWTDVNRYEMWSTNYIATSGTLTFRVTPTNGFYRVAWKSLNKIQ